MKKRLLNLLLCSSAILTFLSSCQKEVEVSKNEEIGNTPLPGLTTYCRVESIWEHPGSFDQRFLLVLYDQYENPAIITTPLPSTGHPYRVFKYDELHRLRQYFGDYGNGFFEFWHFYGFDLNGRIGVDTVYLLGSLLDKPTNYEERIISQITYDNQGRIIHVSSISSHGVSFVNTYEYDVNGNLVYPGAPGIVYDNKINLNRTNDIWMFLGKDYSKNNPFNADAYNTAMYPTVINASRNINWISSDIDLTHSQIGYSCRPAYF